jgi:hypothetical protein
VARKPQRGNSVDEEHLAAIDSASAKEFIGAESHIIKGSNVTGYTA